MENLRYRTIKFFLSTTVLGPVPNKESYLINCIRHLFEQNSWKPLLLTNIR